jgi:DNA-binding MarR family transcriptional regulator
MDPHWLAQEELETWTGFLAASQLIEGLIDADLRRAWGITHSEYEILAVLSQQTEHKMRMGTLARTVITAKSALTYRIASLERAGLVTRVRPNDDGRGLEAHLTTKGEQLLNEAAPHHVASVRRYFIDQLQPCELTELRAAMAKLFSSLQERPTQLDCTAELFPESVTDQDCRERARKEPLCSTTTEAVRESLYQGTEREETR